MNKTIGLVLPNTPCYSETFFVSKIKGLSEAGYNIVLFARKNGGDLSFLPKGIKVIEPYSVPSSYIWQLFKTVAVLIWLFIKAPKAAKRLIELEKRDGTSAQEIIKLLYINAHILPQKVDWLHFGFATMGIGRENVAKAIGAKSAVSFRGYDISRYPLKNKRCYEKLFSKIDKVHSISNYLHKLACKYGLINSIEYQKITPAIDCCKFMQAKVIWKNTDKIKIVTTGRLSWVKGYDYALQALAHLPFDFEYTIIGEGKDRERLMFAAYQFGIADKVNFAGKQPHNKIIEYLSCSQIYLQPSVQEGFCNSVLEAQAAGLICIVSDAEGLPENVENNRSGFVVPKRSPKAMAHKIEEVVAMNAEERQQISDYAVQRVQRVFNIKDQIDKFIKFYE